MTENRYGFFRTTTGDMYKFTMWESLLMGAAVAPTDPVLASAVSTSALAISQVPARLRHTITAGTYPALYWQSLLIAFTQSLD